MKIPWKWFIVSDCFKGVLSSWSCFIKFWILQILMEKKKRKLMMITGIIFIKYYAGKNTCSLTSLIVKKRLLKSMHFLLACRIIQHVWIQLWIVCTSQAIKSTFLIAIIYNLFRKVKSEIMFILVQNCFYGMFSSINEVLLLERK